MKYIHTVVAVVAVNTTIHLLIWMRFTHHRRNVYLFPFCCNFMTAIRILKKNSAIQRGHYRPGELTKPLFVLAQMGYYLQLVAFIVHLSMPYIWYCGSVSIWLFRSRNVRPACCYFASAFPKDEPILHSDKFLILWLLHSIYYYFIAFLKNQIILKNSFN